MTTTYTDEMMRERLAQARSYTMVVLRVTEKFGMDGTKDIIWEHGRLIDLARYGMPDYAMFYHFNNSAQIVGYTFTDDIQATLWT